MVMKAVQQVRLPSPSPICSAEYRHNVPQLLFDVDWRDQAGDLDVLVIDMPPGTGDVQLSLGQLVIVDGKVSLPLPRPRSVMLIGGI